MVINGYDEMIPTVPTTNCNFATINKSHLRLKKSSPPQILVQLMNVVSPVPPSVPPPIMPLNNKNGEPKLTMIEADTLAEPIGQTQPELLLYPNGCPPGFPLKSQEPILSVLVQTNNQDQNVTSTNIAHVSLDKIPSSHSEYSTLPPYPDSVNDSTYETPLSTTFPKPLSNMNSVYETPPEQPANPFDIRRTDTPYLTPRSLPHSSSMTVK